MGKNMGKKKIFAIQAVALFLGTMLIPCIVTQISVAERNNVIKNSELIEYTVIITTPDGMIKNTKQIPITDAQIISNTIRETSNELTDTAITKLRQNELIPDHLSDQEIRDLMSGEYGKRFYENLLNKPLSEITFNGVKQRGEWEKNILCSTHIWTSTEEGEWHFLSTLPTDIMYHFLVFLIKIGFKNLEFYLMIPSMWCSLMAWKTKFLIPYVYGDIYPWYVNEGEIRTWSLLGEWSVTTGGAEKVRACVIGGIGIWFFNNAFGIESLDFSGFTLYTMAKQVKE
jgi:hypothetical protein